MVFWLIGLHASIIENTFKISKKSKKILVYIFGHYVFAHKVLPILFCGLCKKGQLSWSTGNYLFTMKNVIFRKTFCAHVEYFHVHSNIF
jgi:hypothetical protein